MEWKYPRCCDLNTNGKVLQQHYSTIYRIAGNFRWCKFSRKCVRTLQKKFSRFLFSRNESVMLWPHPYRWWPRPICTCTKDQTTKRSKLVQQRPTRPFVWRPSRLRKYQDCMPARAKNWLVEQKDSALLILNSTTSERLLRVHWYFVHIVAGWVCFAVTIHREDIIFVADRL